MVDPAQHDAIRRRRRGQLSPLRDRFSEWARPFFGGMDFDAAKVGSSLERLASLAKQREAAGDLPGEAAALTARGILNPSAGPAVDDFDEALGIAGRAHLPAEIIDSILVFRADASRRRPHDDTRKAAPLAPREPDTLAENDPRVAADALADDTLLLLKASGAPTLAQRGATTARLTRVAEDGRLPDHHPLRQVALLRLANLAATDGKLEDAHGYFSRTGLSEEQCSLIGVEPAMKSSGASSNDFPAEALRFGFEGWVDLEFDINANGTTAHARPVVAYPPFVFVDAATGMARNIRYQASFRPSNALACSAHQETISFHIPSNH